MEVFVDSGYEYEQAVEAQNRQKLKNRDKTEEKYINNKQKIIFFDKNENQ